MLRFILCDDNLPILNRLEKMLDSIFLKNDIDAKILYKAKSSNEILDYIKDNPIDVVFLDINLKSDTNGCDIADIIRKKNKNVYIIFLTGHLEYALLAYKYKTFDYLLKPITLERLEETVLRLVEDVKESNSKFLKFNNTVIKQDEINYIKKDGMKLVFCTSSHDYEIYSSFSKIENCLPDNFVRCHKSYIINVNNVTHYTTKDNSVKYEHNAPCCIGAKYKNNFLEVFKNGNITNNLECVNS